MKKISLTILSALLISVFSFKTDSAELITDNFDSLNTTMWGREFAWPVVSNGFARFQLEPGQINSTETWCKLSYDQASGENRKEWSYGIYKMKFEQLSNPVYEGIV